MVAMLKRLGLFMFMQWVIDLLTNPGQSRFLHRSRKGTRCTHRPCGGFHRQSVRCLLLRQAQLFAWDTGSAQNKAAHIQSAAAMVSVERCIRHRLSCLAFGSVAVQPQNHWAPVSPIGFFSTEPPGNDLLISSDRTPPFRASLINTKKLCVSRELFHISRQATEVLRFPPA